MDWFLNNLWVIPAAVVLLGVAIGRQDLLRLSWARIWAIGGVCYQESIRRRVLWIVPLAILGVMGASAFQKAIDQQDQIRQVIQFSLFATGMLVVMTLVILACTNLPREIENRVIFTIVTKPTSRLEIVIGKVVGFARVSALVLGIMGLFTLLYVGVLSVRLQSAIAARLNSPEISQSERTSLEYYQHFGLLTAKRFAVARAVDVLAAEPGADGKYWAPDVTDGNAVVGFVLPPPELAKLAPITGASVTDPKQPALVLRVHVRDRASGTKPAVAPTSEPFISPLVRPTTKALTSVSLQIYSPLGELIADSNALGSSQAVPTDGSAIEVPIQRQMVEVLAERGMFEVHVSNLSPGRQVTLEGNAADLAVMSADRKQTLATIGPAADPVDPSKTLVRYHGRAGRGGQQVRGGAGGTGTVALYRFRNAEFGANPGERVSLELRSSIERDTGSDSDDALDQTQLELTFRNLSAPGAAPVVVRCFPENSRTLYASVPGPAVAGGNFDVYVRSVTAGNWFTAGPGTISLVSGTQPFAWNLAKSLFVMWMMSLLVIAAAVFTSTFVSWPIAVVLTLLLLLGHWGVVQLGDSLQPGIGNSMVTTMGLKDPSAAQAVSKSVEALSSMLRAVSVILPDITQFAASDDIQRGLQLNPLVLEASAVTLALFGLPMLVLSYVCLRYKEVAP